MAAIGSSNTHFLTAGGFTKIALHERTQTEDGEKIRLYHLENLTEEKIEKAKQAILKEVSQKNREYVGDLEDFDIDIQDEPYLLKQGKKLFHLSEEEASEMLNRYSIAVDKRSLQLGLSVGLSFQAGNLFSAGQYEKALGMYFQCLKVVREVRDKEREAGTLYNIGEVFAKVNRYEEAIPHYLECVDILKVIETNESFAELVYRGLGIAYYFHGDKNAAETYYQRYYEASQSKGSQQGMRDALNLLLLLQS